jgi:TatD DNase family protein
MSVRAVSDKNLIDTHAHLNAVEKVKGAIRRAFAVGVKRIVAVGMDLVSNRKTLALTVQYPLMVLPAIGYHPWMIAADAVDETLAFIQSHIGTCVAMGEVGLDYKVKVKKTLQRDVFAKLLGVAQAENKPVIVHSRFSYERCFQMVAAAGIEKAVFHWYSGPLEILDRIIEEGYYISATPALSYSRFHQAAVKKAPLERILIETDSPVAYQGKQSEPADLILTLRSLRRLKGVSIKEAADTTRENAEQFLGVSTV